MRKLIEMAETAPGSNHFVLAPQSPTPSFMDEVPSSSEAFFDELNARCTAEYQAQINAWIILGKVRITY